MSINLAEFFEKIHLELYEISGIKLNQARLSFISLFIGGLIRSRSVQFQEVAHQMDSPAKASSNFRRIQRFLSSYPLSLEWVGLFILLLIPKKGVKLSMDRTNWDFGQVSFNLLVVTLYWDRYGFPIYFEALGDKGNSHTEDRKRVLQRCLDRLGRERILAFPCRPGVYR